ncbi:hypothetical protein [Roseivirga sp.]|uniref:hypothetical protein n=1 Tax=Roseivirga sp. TaxID=1964215 RepID=UPI003B8B041A
MISESEHKVIHKFLKNVGAEHLEVYQELYDHVATSFEKRSITSFDIKTHIREVVQPELGGTKGITRLIKTKTKTFHKEVYGRAWEIFKNYLLGWPGILVSILTIAIVLITKQYWGIEAITKVALILGVMTPPLVSIYGMASFYIQSKRKNLGASNSLRNLAVMHFAGFGTTFTQIIFFLIGGIIFNDSGWMFDQFVASPILGLTVSVIFILYGCVSLQLLNEKFQFKITTA